MPTIPDLPPATPPKKRVPRTRLKASARKVGRVGRRALWIGSLLGAGLLLVAVLAWGVLLFQILPRIDAWRFDLAEQATKALGVPVRIGQVVGRADGIWPTLSLREVQLLDSAGRVALRLPEVTARVSLSTLSPRALADGELRLDQLVLVAPELDVRRDAAGDIHIAGLRLASSAGAGSSSAADWVFSQALIRISHGTVRWTDEWLHAPTLSLKQLDLSLRNHAGLGRRVHELTLEATPPTEFGQRFSLKAALTQPLWLASGMPTKVGDSAPWWRRWELEATRPGQWQTWSGSLTANLPHVDVQQLKQHVAMPINVDGGRGRVLAELSLSDGAPNGFKLDVDLRDINVQLARNLAPLAFRQLSGQVSVLHEAELSTLSFKNLAFVLSEGLVWPSSSATVSWRHAPLSEGLSDSVWRLTRGGDVQADRVDLALVARVIDRLPLAPHVRSLLADIAPHGVVEQLAWQWDGLLEAPQHYKASGRIKGLGWAASEKNSRPGLAHADVTVSADESGGRADLMIKNGWLELPGVFEEPRLPLTALQAKVNWSLKPSRNPSAPSDFFVDVTEASFANDDAHGQVEGHWRTGSDKPGIHGQPVPRFPGSLNLTGRVERAEANRVWRYLPLAIPKGPRDYVQQAIHSGQGERVSFDVEGDLSEFPFKDDVGGRFRVKVPLHNVALEYVPSALRSPQAVARMGAWPAFTSLDGMLLFEGQRMLIQEAHGRLGSVGSGAFTLRNVEGRIDDLGQHEPHLTIQGQGDGPLNDLVRFLAQSPVGYWTGNLMVHAQSTGTGAMQLSLDIPLEHTEDTKLQGVATLTERDQASLRLSPSIPMFAALQGTVAFTESDLTVKAKTRVWGHQMDVDGRRGSDGATRFVARGAMSAEGLRQAQELPLLQRLAQRLTGESPVNVTVTMAKAGASGAATGPQVQITSGLQGMAANLPAPLNKPAQAVWPLNVIYKQDDAQGHNDSIFVDLGNPQSAQMTSMVMPWLRVDLRRDTSGEQARALRGTMSLIQAATDGAAGVPALPPQGVAAQLAVPTLDLDQWQSVLQLFKPADGQRTASASSADATESYLPNSLTIRTGALLYKQRTLKDVTGTLAHPAPGVWRAQVDSHQVAGQIEWLPETEPLATGPGASRVVARLSRLLVPNADAQALQEQAAEQMLSGDVTSTLPALDIVVDQFEWRGLPLGRLEVDAVNRLVPVVGGPPLPEWRMTKLRMTTPDAQLNATGNWTALGAQSAARREGGAAKLRPRSAFGFTLDLQNTGSLLARLGLPQTLKGGKGKLTGQVAWLGSPMEPDPLTMTGDVNVQISEGQLLKVEPGIARLLGVLSLQSLARRLTLDFRDVLQEGFAFDSIDGDVKIAQGTATTHNLRMRGVQAVVLMEGQADIAHETQNLHVYVVPDVNAGGASLAYAAINPVVGLGTFLAQVLLRKQVADAGTQEFKVTGPWADPQVEKVASRAEAVAAASAVEAAASSITKPRKPF